MSASSCPLPQSCHRPPLRPHYSFVPPPMTPLLRPHYSFVPPPITPSLRPHYSFVPPLMTPLLRPHYALITHSCHRPCLRPCGCNECPRAAPLACPPPPFRPARPFVHACACVCMRVHACACAHIRVCVRVCARPLLLVEPLHQSSGRGSVHVHVLMCGLHITYPLLLVEPLHQSSGRSYGLVIQLHRRGILEGRVEV